MQARTRLPRNGLAAAGPAHRIRTAASVLEFQMPEAVTRWQLLALAHDRQPARWASWPGSSSRRSKSRLRPTRRASCGQGDAFTFPAKFSNLTDQRHQRHGPALPARRRHGPGHHLASCCRACPAAGRGRRGPPERRAGLGNAACPPTSRRRP
ncbi:MAG: hypothetical protein WKG07_20380 [Hymenobacter sp.]